MKYCVLSKNGEVKAVKAIKRPVQDYINKGWNAMAMADSKEKAEGIVMGLNAHYVVEKYAARLDEDIKVAFKAEIAHIAASMYNKIIS